MSYKGVDKELRALVKFLRTNGIVSYKNNGLELLLDPNYRELPVTAAKHIPGQLASDLSKAAPGFFGMTEEQLLMHSSGGASQSES